MEMIVRPCLRAKGISSGSRSIRPSSPAISTMRRPGRSPASRARSTAASVWPCAVQDAAVLGAQREDVAGADEVGGLGVAARRAAGAWWRGRRPRCRWSRRARRASTETVKAVFIDSVLSSTICGSSSRSSSSRGPSGTQIRPRHSLIMKATISGVAFSAATIRSPSFSRSSSSTTTMGRPAAMSAMACSTGSRRSPR